MHDKYYAYNNYAEYINKQVSRSSSSYNLTRKYEQRRIYIYNRMKELGINGHKILCVGARDDSELDFFRERGYEVDGIDLVSNGRIMKCDMSKIHESRYFQQQRYDIVFSSDSIEHCLDLEGFVRGLNIICSGYFICMCPVVKEPNMWDCSRHLFMVGVDDFGTYCRNLRKCFPYFSIIINEVHKKGKRLFFILKRLL